MSSFLSSRRAALAGTIFGALLVCAVPARAAEVEPAADRVLRNMDEYLGQSTRFTLRVEQLFDAVLELGPMVQMRSTSEVAVRRPDRLRVITRGDSEQQELWFDGKEFTLFDPEQGLYGTVEVPPSLDAALDYVAEKYGLTFALSDFVYPDVYKVLMGKVQRGLYLGRRSVRGRSAHHLLFIQEDIDWQLWVADGFAAVPLKAVITFKKEPGSPRLMAWFSDWTFSPLLPDSVFQFAPPPGAEGVGFGEMVGDRPRPGKERSQ